MLRPLTEPPIAVVRFNPLSFTKHGSTGECHEAISSCAVGVTAGVALALAGASATAGGLGRDRGSIKDEPYPDPYNWGGLYLGLHAGGGWADVDWTLLSPGFDERIGSDDSLFAWGGQIGFLHQWGNIVAEAEISLSSLNLDHTVPSNPQAGGVADRSRTVEIDSLLLVTARLGYAWDRSLVYIKGGYANAPVQFTTTEASTGILTTNTREREHGWTVGGGWEYAIKPDIILGVEYNFVRLSIDDRDAPGLNAFGDAAIEDASADIHIVSARLSFKFGLSDPRPMK